MAKSEKYFEIPRGNEQETDNIRQALMDKIKKQEQISNNQAREYANQPVQRPTSTNMSFQQYQQRQAPQPQQRTVQRTNPNQYANYGTYSSPFANEAPKKDNLVSATHSAEPIKYKPKKRKSAGKTFLLLVIMVAIIFGLSWALREFVFQAYEIPSGSMEKTINTGDMVFAEKVSIKFNTPKAGDIVTFDDPQNDGRILIKRVVATGGQTVDIRDNKLYIDNVEQHEDYVNGLSTTKLSRSSISYPYKVPDDCVWVMGDNRTNSQDSRYFGAIPTSSIIGRALFVYWPYND